jgi:hypothetical protein
MAEDHHICAVCAWRKDCVKKFKDSKELGSGKLKCPDYTRDVTIKDLGPSDKEIAESKNKSSKKKLWDW